MESDPGLTGRTDWRTELMCADDDVLSEPTV